MNSITIAHLEAVCARINTLSGSPLAPYTKQGGKTIANVGNYHLSGAYGGYALYRMSNGSGGVEDVLQCGHTTKRDLADRMHAFIRGYETAALVARELATT